MKNAITRHGKMLGAYVPLPIVNAINTWVNSGNERDISTFIREAARLKLSSEGIVVAERETTSN